MWYPWAPIPDDAAPWALRLTLGRAALQDLWGQHGWVCFAEGAIVAALVFLIIDYARRGRES